MFDVMGTFEPTILMLSGS